jgi:NAD(P)-dependent dehydrogenase (short-subunit alcohol dehydrogenase family)
MSTKAKLAVVTGARRGLGAAIATVLASEGWSMWDWSHVPHTHQDKRKQEETADAMIEYLTLSGQESPHVDNSTSQCRFAHGMRNELLTCSKQG